MVHAVKFETIVYLIHAITMVFASKPLRVIYADALIHIQAPIVKKVCPEFLQFPCYFSSFSDHYYDNNHNHNHDHGCCYTSTMWFELSMCCHTMSNRHCLQSLCTQSLVRSSFQCFFWCSSSFFSQNMGGCAVQNNIARCYCSTYYTGYYCQFRMYI